jgi:4-phytase/acid phosphatase
MSHAFQRRALRCLTLLLCAAPPLLAQSAGGASGKLKFVIIFSRHGVRTPTGSSEQLNQYSAQPWPKWDSPSGNLTAQGARLMTLFGRYYRAYLAQQGLLDADGCADATRVSFFADSDQRTAETGKSLAAGMFRGCASGQQPEQHTLPEGQVDPLFHSLAAGVGQPDRKRASPKRIVCNSTRCSASFSDVLRPPRVLSRATPRPLSCSICRPALWAARAIISRI